MLKLAPHGRKLAGALLAWAAACCPGCGVAGIVEVQSDAQVCGHKAFLTLVVVVQAMLIVWFFTNPKKAAQAPQVVDVGVQIVEDLQKQKHEVVDAKHVIVTPTGDCYHTSMNCPPLHHARISKRRQCTCCRYG